jgi:hypothetical protein
MTKCLLKIKPEAFIRGVSTVMAEPPGTIS